MNYLYRHFDDVLEMTFQHLYIVVLTVVIAFIISFPLGLFINRHKKASPIVNAICNAIFSIPSLALLVLLIPITGLGTTTTLVALVLYNLYLLIKNIAEGFDEVSPSILEIGRGMGMSKMQLFFSVEIPLAMPLILSGLKFSVLSTTAMATLGAVVGGGGLGNIIFSGLVTRSWNKVIIGTVASTLVACVFSLLLQFAENRSLKAINGNVKKAR